MPLSRMRISTVRARRAVALTLMRPPSSVYFAALPSTLPMRLRQARGIAETASIPGSGSSTVSSCSRSSATAAPSRPPAPSSASSSTTALLMLILPRVMRDTSSRSSTSRVRCASCRSMTSRAQLELRIGDRPHAHELARRCGSAPADCAARARAWPGTHPCAGRLPLALLDARALARFSLCSERLAASSSDSPRCRARLRVSSSRVFSACRVMLASASARSPAPRCC